MVRLVDKKIDTQGLIRLPGLIDPHVHFRTPGHEYKENWETAAQAAIAGGYTTVFDMPNTEPPTTTAERLIAKKALINTQLQSIGIPLRYHLYFGADKTTLDQIPLIKNDVIGIKVFMGCSTGGLLIADEESLHRVFKAAAENNLLVAVHAEDHELIEERSKRAQANYDYAQHSDIRSPEVAATAVARAIRLAEQYGVRLYILHVSSADELNLIRQAKDKGLPVYAETTPHHLFLSTQDYPQLHGKAQMNPPLRHPEHHAHLWSAIHDGTIDTIGSDHAPHTLEEKAQPYGACPSGVPGIELTLPLLLNAHHQGLLSLAEIIRLTSERPREIFKLPEHADDGVWVNTALSKLVDESCLKTKCGWSPFAGKMLTGWPVYTELKGQMFSLVK